MDLSRGPTGERMTQRMDRTATPGNMWDRIIFLERRLQFLTENAATPVVNPEAGEGEIIYVDVDASETSILGIIKKILRFSGIELYAYNNNDVGMTTCIAASIAGDTILLPTCSLANDYTIPADVTVVGRSIEDCIFTGEITLSDGSSLENLSIIRSEDDAGAIIGIVEGVGTITAIIKNVTANVANATGAAYAIYLENGGTIKAYDSELLAETGSVGYAAYALDGNFYQYGGRAVGTTSLLPYFS